LKKLPAPLSAGGAGQAACSKRTVMAAEGAAGQPGAEELAARLQPRWASLCKELGVEPDRQQRWWQTIVTRHSEPQRSYHTLAHLDELFFHLDAAEGLVGDKAAVSLAIFFHDIIYDPRAGSPSNETRSAEIFDAFGQEALPAGEPLGLAKGKLIAKVRRWIVQTATHKTSDDDDEDCKLFMDFDMAILGSDPDRYARYAQQIRREYIHVPEAIYCRARAVFLRSTVEACTADGEAAHIFATTAFRQSHEQQARENMGLEAAQLSGRLRSCGFLARKTADVVAAPSSKTWGRRAGVGCAFGIAAAVAALRPMWATAACASLGVGVAAFGLRLAFGARYVRHPYPEPSGDDGSTVVIAGSYNPPHLGHLEMLRYLSKAHAKVVAVIGVNPNKTYQVSAYQRQELLRAMIASLGLANVEVVVWAGLIFDYARSVGASAMYRGIRTWKEDGRSEKFLEFQNLFFQPVYGHWPIPTAYLQGDPKLSTVSSTLLRKRLAAGESICDLVPEACAAAVQQAYAPTPTDARG